MTDPRIEKIACALAMLNVESDDSWKLYIQDAEVALIAIGQVWQPIETAPKDGARFLATLSNGWIVILSETGQDRYAWYQTSSKIHIPVARTHPRDSLKESILATHWMPLPDAPKP